MALAFQIMRPVLGSAHSQLGQPPQLQSSCPATEAPLPETSMAIERASDSRDASVMDIARSSESLPSAKTDRVGSERAVLAQMEQVMSAERAALAKRDHVMRAEKAHSGTPEQVTSCERGILAKLEHVMSAERAALARQDHVMSAEKATLAKPADSCADKDDSGLVIEAMREEAMDSITTSADVEQASKRQKLCDGNAAQVPSLPSLASPNISRV